jgi:nonribosomal peptide synthetase MxcG
MGERLSLSAAQHGVWTWQQLDPDSPAFNTAEYVEIRGPVRVDVLTAAIRQVVDEAEALGVRFTDDDDGPSQHLGQTSEWTPHVADLSGHADPLAVARAWMADDLARPVDLMADPVFGHALFQLAADRLVWYHRVHHIALDGYGLGLIARRVAEVYTAMIERREPVECGFGSLRAVVDEDLAYQNSERYQRDRDYWVTYAADRPEPVTLAGRFGPLSPAILRCEDHLDESTVDALREAARAAKAFWTDALTAAFAAYLHRMTGARQLNLGLPVMSRMGSVALRVPCMVLNVVPVWVAVEPAVSLAELTSRVATEIRRGRPHHRYRYEQLRRDLKLVASDRKLLGPSVNIMPFDYGLSFAGHPAVVRNVSAGALVEDMMINIYDRADGSGVHITFDANPACYTMDQLTVHLRRFGHFLADLATHPTQPIGQATLLLEEERRLLRKWNDTARPVASATVPDLFRAQVARTPERTALVAEDRVLSFAELDAATNRLARFLVARGAGPDRYIALVLPRTSSAIIALLAVLKTGAAYVPIDPDYPPARVAFLLDDARPVLTLTTRALTTELPDGIAIDDPDVTAAIAAQSGEQLTDADRIAPLTPDTALCLIYTSGSTGIPKGAVLEHAGMVNLFHHHHEHLIRPEVSAAGGRRFRAALTASLSFDTSWEGLLWLLAGHELHFIGDDLRREPERLLRYIDAERIDFLDITPTYAEELLAGLRGGAWHSPAVIALGGEAVGARLWTALRDLPGLSAYNLYGPTECTVDTLWCRLADSDVPIIGRPVTNTRAYVLDEQRRLLPPGAVGELYLAGTPLARGYHNRPELTEQRFLDDPFGSPGSRLYRTGDLASWRRDGNLEFLGRADDQVKIRGFRVEPGEIESVLSGHPGVAKAAVTVREDQPGTRRLVAYVVAADGTAPDSATLGRYLAERLPDYLVPRIFVPLDRLPLNPNGKLDRAALPAPEPAAPGRGPRDHRERLLCTLFAETLGVPEIGIDDDFFALGGHSLLAARLLARIRSAFGVRLSVRIVFQAPTVAALAQHLDAEPADDSPWAGIDLNAEAVPDSRITTAGCRLDAPVRAFDPGRVLLTGATGFLGAFLLQSLLEHTRAEIVCLIRAADDTQAADRLQRTLLKYLLWDNRLADRIVVAIAGDLTRPDLGVGAKRFVELAEDIDAIYHNGARVNHLEPYARLRLANVDGTSEVLRLATTTRLKPVHYVSTCDVAVNMGDNPAVLREDLRVDARSLMPNGYVASKWVAEGLVRAAAERGVPVVIYRPSRVCGHTVTGAGSIDDSFWNLIRAMVVLAAAPVVGEQTVDLVPADHVAAAIAHLSRQPGSIGKTFHLTNPRPVPIRLVLNVLRQRGYELAEIPSAEWARRLAAGAEQAAEAGDYTLGMLAAQLGSHPMDAVPTLVFGRDNTLAGLSGSAVPPPSVDAESIGRYVDYFIDFGFFPRPGIRAR